MTILNYDEGIDSRNIKEKLQESLQMHSSTASLQVLDTEIYGNLYCSVCCVYLRSLMDFRLIHFSDACPSQNISLVAGSNITISWRETAITQQANRPCPCQNLTRRFGSVIIRHCGGSYSQGARWEDMDYSHCGFTDRIIRLCEALQVRNTHHVVW